MRIGIGIRNFDPKKGGAERYAFDLSTNLWKRGHEVVVFCARGVAHEGIKLVRLNCVSFPHWLRPLSFALGHKTPCKGTEPRRHARVREHLRGGRVPKPRRRPAYLDGTGDRELPRSPGTGAEGASPQEQHQSENTAVDSGICHTKRHVQKGRGHIGYDKEQTWPPISTLATTRSR